MADPFQPKFVDLVRNTTTTTGTGNIVLGAAVSGFTGFASAVLAGESFYYSMLGVDKPAEREVGRGTMQSNGTISRDPISGTKTNFTNGNKTIALITAAEWFTQIQSAGAAGGNSATATRVALAARSASAGPANLAEAGREGLFAFDSSNVSARVSADPRQGLYVAPANDPSGASGAWVRRYSGSVNVKWFGATGDGTSDDGAAFTAALALLKATAVNDDLYYSKGSPGLFVPAGHYFLNTTTLDISHTLIIEGESSINGVSSRLRWADNTTGIRIQSYNTSGSSAVDAPHYSGSGTLIRNLAIVGGVAGSEAGLIGPEGEYHGIHAKAVFTLEDVYINGFRGDGVYVHTSAGAGSPDEGNANSSHINRLRVTNVRDGLNIDGADANVITTLGVNGTYCRRWTINDSSFLGNTHIGAHSANSGIVPGVAPSVVSHSGNRFAVIAGQEAWASTNAPPTSATSNQGWSYMGSGAPEPIFNIPAWASGMTLRAGGGYRTDSLNAPNLFEGCYTEQGQGPSQFVFPTAYRGGLHGAGVIGTGSFSGYSIDMPQGTVKAARTTAKEAVGPGVYLGTIHNSAAHTFSGKSNLGFASGYEANAVDPAFMGSIYAYGTNSPANQAEGIVGIAARQWTTGAMVARAQYNEAAQAWQPVDNNLISNGTSGTRWKKGWYVDADLSGNLVAGGNIAATGTVSGSNLSGTNSGDQTITLTGDVTGSGTGSFVATIGANKVTYAQIQQLSATAKLLGRAGAGAGNVEEVGLAGGLGMSGGSLTLGAITPTSVATTGGVTSSSASAGLGYTTGAGGAVVQATSKSTGVTLSKTCGRITTHGAALAAAAVVSFTVTNTIVTATDAINLCLQSGNAGAGAYRYWIDKVSAGSFVIAIENRSGGSLSEALVFNFTVLKSVIA